MPMTDTGGCRCRWKVVCRLPMMTGGGEGIADRMVVVCRLTVVDRLMFSIAIRVRFVYGFHSIWN